MKRPLLSDNVIMILFAMFLSLFVGTRKAYGAVAACVVADGLLKQKNGYSGEPRSLYRHPIRPRSRY